MIIEMKGPSLTEEMPAFISKRFVGMFLRDFVKWNLGKFIDKSIYKSKSFSRNFTNLALNKKHKYKFFLSDIDSQLWKSHHVYYQIMSGEWNNAEKVDTLILLFNGLREEGYEIIHISLDYHLKEFDPNHTGYDFMLFLEEMVYDKKITKEEFPIITFHTDHKRGYTKMLKSLNKIQKYLDLPISTPHSSRFHLPYCSYCDW
jgi:hypothetical protein